MTTKALSYIGLAKAIQRLEGREKIVAINDLIGRIANVLKTSSFSERPLREIDISNNEWGQTSDMTLEELITLLEGSQCLGYDFKQGELFMIPTIETRIVLVCSRILAKLAEARGACVEAS